MTDLYLAAAFLFVLALGVLIGIGLSVREVRGARKGYVDLRPIGEALRTHKDFWGERG